MSFTKWRDGIAISKLDLDNHEDANNISNKTILLGLPFYCPCKCKFVDRFPVVSILGHSLVLYKILSATISIQLPSLRSRPFSIQEKYILLQEDGKLWTHLGSVFTDVHRSEWD